MIDMKSSLRVFRYAAPDVETRPEPWVCEACGHTRQPNWLRQDGCWNLYEGACEVCQARRDGAWLLTQQREQTMRNYGMLDGIRKEMRLDTYRPDPDHPSQAEALRRARQVVETWRAGDWTRGMLIMSEDVGIGKTHLAVGAAYEGLQFCEPSEVGGTLFAMVTVSELLKQIRSSYDIPEENE